jgi:RNA polymerase sigma-70 factor (ECF subfamily)
MSEGAVKVAVHRLRRRYRDLLLDGIAQTLAEGESLDEELHYLLSAIGT